MNNRIQGSSRGQQTRSSRSSQRTRPSGRSGQAAQASRARRRAGLAGGRVAGNRRRAGSSQSPQTRAQRAAGATRRAASAAPAGNLRGVRDLRPFESHIQDAARQYGLDPNLIRGVIAQESKGDPNARSRAGARGLMQLMPATARSLGVTNPNDPRQNILAGSRYLSQQMRRNGGNVERALWAYNAGPGNLANGVKPRETQRYIPAVLNYMNQYRSQGQNAS